MDEYEINVEQLRKRLLEEAFGGAFSGLDTMILDITNIERASADELLEIARRYGIK